MLVDSDVLIWHLRGLPQATMRLDALPRLTISAVTSFEILQGMRNRAYLIAVQKSLALRSAEQLPLTPQNEAKPYVVRNNAKFLALAGIKP